MPCKTNSNQTEDVFTGFQPPTAILPTWDPGRDLHTSYFGSGLPFLINQRHCGYRFVMKVMFCAEGPWKIGDNLSANHWNHHNRQLFAFWVDLELSMRWEGILAFMMMDRNVCRFDK